MSAWRFLSLLVVFTTVAACGACGGLPEDGAPGGAKLLADTTFLADIAQNVAGGRFEVSSLIPWGVDPHSFEPTPGDARRLADCRAMVVNVKGLLPAVDDLLAGVTGSDTLLIEAAYGLPDLDEDPHCWLDPVLVITYTQNIADRLSLLDPEGADVFRENAAAYADQLRSLDSWIVSQVQSIPPERRLLVTNHESLGRFAARYGFKVVGTIFATPSGEGSPSARGLSGLVAEISATGAPAIFVETGSNAALAQQVGVEAGVAVITDLYTHSLSEAAPTYLDMMRWNVAKIVEALR